MQKNWGDVEQPTKQTIFGWEKDNLDKIFLLKGEKFWRVYQNSALYFQKLIWEKIKLRQKYDPIARQEIILLGFSEESLFDVLDKVKNEKFQLLPTKSENLIIIKLPKKQPPGQLKKWFEEQDDYEEKARILVSPYYAGQSGYKAIYDLFLSVQHIVRHLPKEMKHVFGRKMLETVLDINRDYKKLTSKVVTWEGKMKILIEMDEGINDLFLIVRMALEIQGVEKQTVINFSYQGREVVKKIDFWKKKIETNKTVID